MEVEENVEILKDIESQLLQIAGFAQRLVTILNLSGEKADTVPCFVGLSAPRG